MELVFDDRGLLQLGVHDVTMEIVKEQFGRFQSTDRRQKLFAKLSEYVDAVRRAECGESIVLDGSFVMACVDVPGDIDLVLILPAGWDRAAELKPFQYHLVSKREAKRVYGFDMLATVVAGSPEEMKAIEFFGQVNVKWRQKYGWPEETRKGIIRVTL